MAESSRAKMRITDGNTVNSIRVTTRSKYVTIVAVNQLISTPRRSSQTTCSSDFRQFINTTTSTSTATTSSAILEFARIYKVCFPLPRDDSDNSHLPGCYYKVKRNVDTRIILLSWSLRNLCTLNYLLSTREKCRLQQCGLGRKKICFHSNANATKVNEKLLAEYRKLSRAVPTRFVRVRTSFSLYQATSKGSRQKQENCGENFKILNQLYPYFCCHGLRGGGCQMGAMLIFKIFPYIFRKPLDIIFEFLLTPPLV